MNRTRVILGAAVGIAAGLAGACGGNDDHAAAPMPPPPSSMRALDTAQVLALAQQTSEMSAPFAVNAGALTLTDTSETSAPIAVDSM